MAFPPHLLTAFSQASFRAKPLEAYYVKRFWIVSNKKEYQDMINFASEIDMVLMPEVKVYPCIFELRNNNGPVLEEVSPLYLKQKIEDSKKMTNATEAEFDKTFKGLI